MLTTRGLLRRFFRVGSLLVLVATFTLSAAAEESRTSFDDQLDGWLTGLASDDAAVRDAASDHLTNLPSWRLNLPRSLRILKSAERQMPQKKADGEDPSVMLVSLVAKRPRLEQIPAIVESYGKYNPATREAALDLLALIDDPAAPRALMQLVRDHASTGGIPRLNWEAWTSFPLTAEIFFPELLDYCEHASIEPQILQLLEVQCSEARLSADMLSRCAPKVVERYRVHKKKMFPAQSGEGTAWRWEKEYRAEQTVTMGLLDVLGYCAGNDDARSELRKALGYRDPNLKLHAAVSLLRLDEHVDAATFEQIAANADTRNALFSALERLDSLEHFPEKQRTQAALAESDLVHWLAEWSELGRTPDEIELMKVVSIDPQTEEGELDYYVFRFRMLPPHPKADLGWMAGVAGPFLRRDQPTTDSQGNTQSAFEAYDSRTPESHVGDVNEIVQEWRWRSGLQD